MSQGGYVNIVGFVAQDPTIRATRSGRVLTKLRVGVAPRYQDSQGEWRDREVSYYDVACWGRLAHNVRGSMHKGDPVTLKGRFRTSTFEDKHGHLRTSIEITADTVGHDLNRGQATFLRPPPLRAGEDNRQAARAASAPEPAGGADEDFMDDEAIERLGRDLDEADLATQALREHERLAGADDHEDSEDADDDDSEEEAYQNAALANDAPDADTAVGTVPPVPATPF